VTIRLKGHVSGAGLDQAPVSVNFAEAVANNVLSVPVTALLASAGGAYAVQEAQAPHELIPVTTGLFAAGYVQISGPGSTPACRSPTRRDERVTAQLGSTGGSTSGDTLVDGTPPDGIALALEDVVKEYPGEVFALRGVSVEIPAGDQVAVVGPSGSGKTTLLTIMGTLERATGGRVRVAGHDLGSVSDVELAGLRAYEIGFVFQEFHLQEAMSATDNVALGMLYTGQPLGQRRQAARVALERVGLGHRLEFQPKQLSGGERQRVAIARAIAKRPLIILADEPTGNLDQTTGREVIGLLHDLASEGATLVLITHDPNIASTFHRQVQMRDGEIVADEQR
jgi:putative ABC transport system ATP-binding protein